MFTGVIITGRSGKANRVNKAAQEKEWEKKAVAIVWG